MENETPRRRAARVTRRARSRVDGVARDARARSRASSDRRRRASRRRARTRLRVARVDSFGIAPIDSRAPTRENARWRATTAASTARRFGARWRGTARRARARRVAADDARARRARARARRRRGRRAAVDDRARAGGRAAGDGDDGDGDDATRRETARRGDARATRRRGGVRGRGRRARETRGRGGARERVGTRRGGRDARDGKAADGTAATASRASALACCFGFASAGDEETRTLEDLDDEAAREGASAFASPSRAVEAVVEPAVTATRVVEGEDAASSERERVALDRARMEREVRELEIRLRSEEDALRARERSLVERENRIAERERLAADKETEAERRLAELQIEEKRLLNVSQSQRRQDSSTNATTTPEGDLSDVGEAGLKTELGRMRKTTKQFTEKERAMIEQINALRRARDASEARVRSLADELKDTKKDYEMWSKEEKATERKYSSAAAQSPAESSPSPARTTLDDRDLPEWLRSPEPARRDTNLGSPVGPDSVSPTYKKFSPAKLIIPEEASSKTSIEKDAPKTPGENGVQHPIFSAVRNGRVSEAQEILVYNSAEFDVDTRDSFGNTVLIVAAQNNRKRVTKMCVRAGVPLDAQNKQGNTALHYCYGYGYFELGEYLVSKGADERVTNAAGETAYDGLSAENRRALESTRRALVASRDAKRRSRPTAPDRDESSYLASYSDAESAVTFTDDDE